MESRGKLGNDEKVKFVGPRCEMEKKKLVGHKIYGNYHISIPRHFHDSQTDYNIVHLLVEQIDSSRWKSFFKTKLCTTRRY